jgi:hypothetical protein
VAAVLAALVATALVAAGPTPAGAAEDDAAPLTVTLTRLAPSTIPARGRVVLAGTVRNDSSEQWSAINVHPVISASPITDRDQLAAAADSDPTVEIGTRLTDAGQFASIGDLLPGQAAAFRITLRARDLPISRAPGVYWIGVHALGQDRAGRDPVADGRARTFIPLVPDSVRGTSVALVVPLRERVRRDHLGKLLDSSAWAATLRDDGRLERIAALLDTAGGLPATMLVDPAVVEAVASVAADNPPISLGEGTEGPTPPPSESPGGDPSESPRESTSESPGSSAGASAGASRSIERLEPTDRANAARWLAQVKSAATLQHVLGLGYADPDVAALARQRPQLIEAAAKESATAFDRFGIDAVPAVAPASGWLEDSSLASVPARTMVLVSDHSAPRTRTHWRTPEQQDLVFTDEQAGSGGPAPTEPFDALAVRQRIVADAALRALEGSRSPMVVELPAGWDPGPAWQSADFFGGLNLSWLDLEPLVPADDATPLFDAALGYPPSERRNEVGLANVSAARSLVSTGSVLSQLLSSTNDVRHELVGVALEAVSLHARRDPGRAREVVLQANAAMQDRLAKVSVVGTDFVTLSGGSGTLTVTLVNQLDQPIKVGIEPRSSSGEVHIDAPKPFDMAPGQRTVLRLHARASAIGVHEVTLTPVTTEGAALGTSLTFSLRTSQVGKLIWGLLIGSGALLVVTILRRIRRGIREHRWRGQ